MRQDIDRRSWKSGACGWGRPQHTVILGNHCDIGLHAKSESLPTPGYTRQLIIEWTEQL
jgi:hypothetical protein